MRIFPQQPYRNSRQTYSDQHVFDSYFAPTTSAPRGYGGSIGICRHQTSQAGGKESDAHYSAMRCSSGMVHLLVSVNLALLHRRAGFSALPYYQALGIYPCLLCSKLGLSYRDDFPVPFVTGSGSLLLREARLAGFCQTVRDDWIYRLRPPRPRRRLRWRQVIRRRANFPPTRFGPRMTTTCGAAWPSCR